MGIEFAGKEKGAAFGARVLGAFDDDDFVEGAAGGGEARAVRAGEGDFDAGGAVVVAGPEAALVGDGVGNHRRGAEGGPFSR